MRTTVNLDDDVASAVDRLRRERSLGLSEAVNELIRASLATRPSRRPFRQRSQPMGLVIDVSNIGEAIEQLDGPATR
jgi:metal-responsive CopG/Arc/MetJ family transcriptional regulator